MFKFKTKGKRALEAVEILCRVVTEQNKLLLDINDKLDLLGTGGVSTDDDGVTAEQILDEYLNGAKDGDING